MNKPEEHPATLPAEDQLTFAEAITNPPEPNDALKAAFETRRAIAPAE